MQGEGDGQHEPPLPPGKGKDSTMLQLILMIFGFVLFVLAGLGVPNPPNRWNLVALGLACWVLAEILGRGTTLLH